jgi:hypothetical protein
MKPLAVARLRDSSIIGQGEHHVASDSINRAETGAAT